MNYNRIERIFTGDFDAQESKEICFNPSKHHKKAVGLFFSADATVSLAFNHGTDLLFSDLEFAYRHENKDKSPNDRVFDISVALEDQIISGSVTNRKTTHQGDEKRTINIYMIIEHEHEYNDD